MRILHSIHSVNPAGGGVIEAVRQMTLSHQAAGHVVEIVSLDAPEEKWVGSSGLTVHAIGNGRPGYGYSERLVPWLRANAEGYDAIVINGLWQYSSLGVWRALRGAKVPYFVFPHGMLDPWFKRRYPLKHLKKALYWRLAEHRVLRDARTVFFTSEEEKRLAGLSFSHFSCRSEIVPLGIASPNGSPERQIAAFYDQFPELAGKRLILFLGRLHEKKGCDHLIQAWREVAKDPGTHLMLAGPPSDDAYLHALREIAAGTDSISFPGMLSGDLKWGALRVADAFILPSHQENFGMAVVEALACGTPVLISDKVNIWREIQTAEAGLVEMDDLAGTRRVLERWMSLPMAGRVDFRSRALRCFHERFEVGRTARRLIALMGGSAPALSPSLADTI